jgi:hypothetical protein
MSIEDRIARLERENRRLRVGALLGLLTVAAVLLLGQARPARVLEAEAFVLRDRAGVALAGLEVDDDGYPRLGLYDRNGKVRVDFRVGDTNTFVFFRESTGITRMELINYDGASGPIIALRPSTANHDGIVLQSPDAVDPFITLRSSADGRVIWSTGGP